MPKKVDAELERLSSVNFIQTKALYIEKDALIGLINGSGLIDEEIPDWADFVPDEQTGLYSNEELRVEWTQNLTDLRRDVLGGQAVGY